MDLRVERVVMVPMSDGICLATELWIPGRGTGAGVGVRSLHGGTTCRSMSIVGCPTNPSIRAPLCDRSPPRHPGQMSRARLMRPDSIRTIEAPGIEGASRRRTSR